MIKFLLTITALITSVLFILLYFQPRFLLSFLSKHCHGVIYFVKTDQFKIALTIDDAPDATTTPAILDLLSKYETKVTFFLIGEKVLQNEDIVKRIIDDGHEIGNHNFKDETSLFLAEEEFEIQLKKAHEILSKFEKIKWYRPGGGLYNCRLINQIKQLNYTPVLGSVYPYDTIIKFTKFYTYFVVKSSNPGSIIILHDGQRRGARTLKALNEIIPKLRNKGFTFVTLSELIEDKLE